MTVTLTAEELKNRMGEAGLVLVDTRLEPAYRQNTIPGAIFLNVYDYFVPDSTDAIYHGMAAGAWAAFHAAGLDQAKTIVWFEEDTGMRAPRGLWFQELLGLDGGMILDGGLAAWRAAGGDLAPGQGDSIAITHSDARAPSGWRPELAATREEVLHPGAHVDIFDVRRQSEFDGSFKHDCCVRGGRIPGAKFMFYEDMLHNGGYRPASEIRERAIAAGLDPAREVITYCHRGARAATALYGLRLAGFDKVRVYVGSWHEWAGIEGLPIETG